ncbi:MAG: hypothetical protein JWQ78_834 [Sediminibacterium sp.]|nr:hypothetical protein [Sediminibacterium sp.]
MKQLVRSSLLILVVAATMVSCKNNTPREAKYIPKDAGFVLAVDPQQMQDKLQKGGISIDTLINKVFRHDSSDAKDRAKFEDVRDNAGIDWSEKFFLFMLQKKSADSSQSFVFSALGSLKDAGKLEAFLKKHDELKGKEIRKEKDYSYLVTGAGSILAWNDKQVIATMFTPEGRAYYDTVEMTFKKPAPVNVDEAMKQEVNRYFTQKVSESLADVDIFTGMFKEKADGYAFTSANASLAGLSMMPFQIPRLEELLKDNYSASTLSFEDGKIVAKSTTYTNPLLGSVLKQYSGPVVDLSLIENYPSDHINGVVLAAFNPEIVGGLLKQLEVEGLVNTFLQKTGLSSQELYKALKGDIAIVVSDLGMTQIEPQAKQDEKSMMHHKALGKMILNAPVGDKASFAKVMDKAVELGYLVKHDNAYSASGMLAFTGIFIHADDKNLVVASDSLTYVQYMAKTTKANLNKEVLDRLKGKSTAFYFDIANTLNGFISDSTGHFNQSLRTARTTFKDVIATSDNFDGKSIKATFEVRMQDEKQNSLVTLTSLFTDIAVDMRVQAKKERELFPAGVPAIIRTN